MKQTGRAFYRCLAICLFAAAFITLLPAHSPARTSKQSPTNIAVETIEVDPAAPSHPFPHYWEQMFGSGRAILSLRDSYRRDLREVRQATGFKYIRFHAILDDEVGVYDEDGDGRPVYNFSYIDQIYDGLLENGVRPFVELSFMPRETLPRGRLCNRFGTRRLYRHQRIGIAGRVSFLTLRNI